MFGRGVSKVTLCCLLFIQVQATTDYTGMQLRRNFGSFKLVTAGKSTAGQTQDQTSSRTNTLFDDADDIQRQLDNEARDRIKFGRPKTIWVFHFPTHFPSQSSMQSPMEQEQLLRRPREASYKNRRTCEDEEEKMMLSMTPPLRAHHNYTSNLSTYDLLAYLSVVEKNKSTTEAPFRDWDYSNQMQWAKMYTDCAGKSQSPVDLPISGLIKARGARALLFQNFDVKPKTMTLMNDGKRVMLFGEWKSEQRPLIYGGAAHSRRYLFHSLTIHVPSEHTVGGLQYPLESQVLYVSAEYRDMEEALDASQSDPQAFLAVSNLYKYANHTHKGLHEILCTAKGMGIRNATLSAKPLRHFNPPFKEYACYQGSMTTPPCTEALLWLVRGRTLSVARDVAEAAQKLLASDSEPRHLFFRSPQPLNDRKVYLFK